MQQTQKRVPQHLHALFADGTIICLCQLKTSSIPELVQVARSCPVSQIEPTAQCLSGVCNLGEQLAKLSLPDETHYAFPHLSAQQRSLRLKQLTHAQQIEIDVRSIQNQKLMRDGKQISADGQGCTQT